MLSRSSLMWVAVLCFGAQATIGAAQAASAQPGQAAGTSKPAQGTGTSKPAEAPTPPTGVVPPPGYVIGAEDILTVVFWREKDLSAEVVVRPDGMISLPLLNDVQAAGLTPDELRDKVMTEANKFVEDSNATVVVKQINSRKVFITGQVAKPGAYLLAGPMNAVQLIALAGGLLEYAEGDKIRVMRTEKGKPVAYKLNYDSVAEGKNLQQNIELKPGDTILVP